MSLTPGAYDPRFMKPATLCRCGHILECCADCMGWLRQNSMRIAASWQWFVNASLTGGWQPAMLRAADAAEADDRAFFDAYREGYRKLNQ